MITGPEIEDNLEWRIDLSETRLLNQDLVMQIRS